MHEKLDWLIAVIEEVGCCMPKTIIFCNTLTDIAFVFNHLLFKLGGYAYYPPNSARNVILSLVYSILYHGNKIKTPGLQILQREWSSASCNCS
jgi:hypothetical protein